MRAAVRAVLSVVALTLVIIAGAEWHKASAQAPQRLQLQAEASLSDGFYTVKVQALCDTGNGTMLYVVNNSKSAQLQLVQNGCKKAQAER